MLTEKLYERDAYLRSFTSQVRTCEAVEGGFAVTLDATAFYPEGGGQPADRGSLGGAHVLDVQERGDEIVHLCDQKLTVGSEVAGEIDFARRFDHMQQHSGEHIISGILCALYHCDNVGFHLGADVVTIDYNVPMTWEQVLIAEQKANEAVWADRETGITLPSPAELNEIDYRSKKEIEGQVRIVTFPGADCCACCGTHVRRAGEVGLIKVLSCQPFREGVRIEILCGARALKYLSACYDAARESGQALSVKPTEITGATARVLHDLASARERAGKLEQELCEALADLHAGTGDRLLIRPAGEKESPRRLADALAQKIDGLAAVFCGEGSSYAYALIRADHADIAPLVKEMNAALSGRGGGRNGFAQGSVQCSEDEIRAFFAR